MKESSLRWRAVGTYLLEESPPDSGGRNLLGLVQKSHPNLGGTHANQDASSNTSLKKGIVESLKVNVVKHCGPSPAFRQP